MVDNVLVVSSKKEAFQKGAVFPRYKIKGRYNSLVTRVEEEGTRKPT